MKIPYEFYDASPRNCFNGKKKPGPNFINVPVDLTSKRYLLLKTTKGVIKDGCLGYPAPGSHTRPTFPMPPPPRNFQIAQPPPT